jgi:DNA-binding IclR family transcriptional regulator
MLGLLDAFTPEAPVRSAEELIARSGGSRSSGYRYIQTLQRAGLIAPVASGSYVLGPRILELDRQIRLCDPIFNAGEAPLGELAAATGASALLCVLFSDSVVCVRDRPAVGAPAGLFGRGQRRPLFAGAASKVILAYLPPHQLRALYAKHAPAATAAGLGADWEGFKAALRRIRKDGFVQTVGEFNPGIVGIAAPVFNRSTQVLGSVGVALPEDELLGRSAEALVEATVHAGREITRQVQSVETSLDRPARAVG